MSAGAQTIFSPSQSARPLCKALKFIFLGQKHFFACVFAKVCHFLSFLKGFESCEPLLMILGFLFMISRPERGSLKGYGSCDQVGCWRSLQEDQIHAIKIQGSNQATARQADDGQAGRFHGSWSPALGLPGVCPSSRLDDSFHLPSCTLTA